LFKFHFEIHVCARSVKYDFALPMTIPKISVVFFLPLARVSISFANDVFLTVTENERKLREERLVQREIEIERKVREMEVELIKWNDRLQNVRS
jgi:membrane protein implicated in regulation of membrane protease activity